MRSYFFLLAVNAIHTASCFSQQQYAVLSQTRLSPSTLILRAIDEDAVTDAVKLPVPPPVPERLTYSPVATPSSADNLFTWVGLFGAFAGATFAMRQGRKTESTSTSTTRAKASKEVASVYDISVPYDSAAMLAYDEWRKAFGTGPFDETKFKTFKDNYIKVTVSNVVAKKDSRDNGTPVVLESLDGKADQLS